MGGEEDLACPVCLEVLVDPEVVTACSHAVCSACIRRWIRSHTTCPMCRGPAEERHRSAGLSRRAAAAVRPCQWGCGHSANEAGINRHRDRCPSARGRCPHRDPANAVQCAFVGVPSEMEAHVADCPLREGPPCRLCGDTVLANEDHRCEWAHGEPALEACLTSMDEEEFDALRLTIARRMWRKRRNPGEMIMFIRAAMDGESTKGFPNDDVSKWLAWMVVDTLLSHASNTDMWARAAVHMCASIEPAQMAVLRRFASSGAVTGPVGAMLLESTRGSPSKPLESSLREMLKHTKSTRNGLVCGIFLRRRVLTGKQARAVLEAVRRIGPIENSMDVLTHPSVSSAVRRYGIRSAEGAAWVFERIAANFAHCSASQRAVAAVWIDDIVELVKRSDKARRRLAPLAARMAGIDDARRLLVEIER